NACMAARAAETAGKLYGPAGFWKMHAWLFEHSGSFDDGNFAGFLQGLGFDPQPFQQTMLTMDMLAPVQDDIKEGDKLGIKSTPMMFVNGVEIRGWGSDAYALKNAVDAVAKLNPPPISATTFHPPTKETKAAEDANQAIADWQDDKKTPAMAWPDRKQNW